MDNNELLEEIKDLYTEGSFNSRWIEIETNHQIGMLINQYIRESQRAIPPSDRLKIVAEILNKKLNFIEDCSLFAQNTPDLNMTNFDKTISWSQIQRGLRPQKEAKEKLTVAKIKNIVRDRKKFNEERRFGMLAFEDNEILKALDEYRPVEETIKTEGEGE